MYLRCFTGVHGPGLELLADKQCAHVYRGGCSQQQPSAAGLRCSHATALANVGLLALLFPKSTALENIFVLHNEQTLCN